jgi:hypothetical protein
MSLGSNQERTEVRKFFNTREAIPIAERVWSKFEQSSIDSLLDSFGNRVRMVEDGEKRTIHPWISAGKSVILPGYELVMRKPVTWDAASDQGLIDLMDSHGRRSKGMSQQLDDVTEGECKNRWRFLLNRKRTGYSRIINSGT